MNRMILAIVGGYVTALILLIFYREPIFWCLDMTLGKWLDKIERKKKHDRS